MYDLSTHMEAVARELLGEPNPALSKPKELRWGSRGSLAVNLEKGTFYDHEKGEGGGVLDLLQRETGMTNGAAYDWLEARGINVGDGPDPAPRGRTGNRRITACYPYHDASGALLFEVVRFEPKDFRQRRPDPSAGDGWSWNLNGVERVLYRLPALLEAPEGAIVFVTEGEKDADELAKLDLHATTSPQGAGKWQDAYADGLTDIRVVAIADNDEPGERHAAAVVSSFRKRGIPAAVLRLEGLPEKGDVSDWLDAGGKPDELLRRAEAALEAPQDDPEPEGPLLAFAPASDLVGRPVAPREWLVPALVPARTVTMLGGDGGTGKSLLALQLAVATATGRDWIGREVKAGKVMFLSAEDDADELHRRFADILATEDVDFTELRDLHVTSLAGRDALLAVQDRTTGALIPTPLLGALDAQIARIGPALVVLDTLADLHAGEENSRAHARQFIGMLRGLAIRHGCAVLLLAHPSLSGMASGSGLSGSTAWNASVRSRLYLGRVGDGDYEANPDARRLVTKKANYGPSGGEIGLTWRDGVFVADAVETGLERIARNAKAERVFLALLHLFDAQGRDANHSGGSNYAPKVFSEHPDAEGVTKRAFRDAMERLLSEGKITVEKFGPPSRPSRRLAVA